MELRLQLRVRAFFALAAASLILATAFGVLISQPAAAAQTIPYKINFQGRLTDSSGNILTDGSYNIKFRIFNASSGGTNIWEEDRVFDASDRRITVTNGLFNVQFGDLTALSPSLFSGTFPLYLEAELPTPATATCAANGCASFTEGAMTPRQPLASSPYAFSADTLDGLDSSSFVQLSAAQQTGSINVNGNITAGGNLQAGTIDAAASGALTLGGANATSISLAKNTTLAGGLTMTLQGSNALVLGSTSASGGILFKDGTANNFAVTLTAPALAASYSLSLPTTAPTGSGQCLQTTSATQLAFGACDTVPTLQSVYTASSPATITLASAKDFAIVSPDVATDPSVVVDLQCTTCSANGGRFAVQDSGTDVFAVNPSGSIVIAPTSGQNISLNLPAASGVRVSSSAAPTVDQVAIDNTASTGVTTAGVNGLSVNYKGGAAAVEAAGIRVDYAPGATSGGTWSGLRIVANATPAASGVTSYGIKLEGPTSSGTGQDTGLYITGTGWDIGIDIRSGGLQLAAQSDPASPAAGNLRIYAKDIAGRIMPKWVGPSGVDTPFQANLGFNRVAWCNPSGGTTLTTFIACMGSAFTNVGTANNPTPTTTNLLTSTRRATYSTGTISGSLASHRQSTLQVWRGNAAGLGGFFYTIRFGTDTLVSGNRAFVGLADSVSAPTNVDPTTTTTPGKIGVAINANTGNWKLVNNVTGTAPTVLDLGASFPVTTTSLYELVLYAAPNASSVGWRVTNISTGAQTSGSLSTNIPASTTFLAPQFWITNNATASAAILDFGGWYLESDN